MTKAVTVRRDGDTFQVRLFWLRAARLLDPDSPVIQVGFEIGPKNFDDIWVEYDTKRSARGNVMGPCHGSPARRQNWRSAWSAGNNA
jgi:hypothetical protein